MPIHQGKDKYGYFYQYGNRGAKYYFNPISQASREKAYILAVKQMRAIYRSGYRER